MNNLKSYLKSIKTILSIIQFKEQNIDKIQYVDEFYNGFNNKQTELRVFYSHKKATHSIIIFPGASPYAENHPGMIMLGNAFRDAGYNVFLPRIPSLKDLKLEKENVQWFAHCYEQLLLHKIIDKNKVMVAGLSYGGATLLRASLDSRMQNNKPLSYLSYGTYYSIDTALNFFLTGKINYNNKTYNIPPHEWGMIVLFYNFILSIETEFDKETIRKLLKHRIADEEDAVEQIKNTLDIKNNDFINLILSGEINETIEKMVKDIIRSNKDLLSYLSPDLFAQNVQDKVFIMHGANDSMVPFTESILLDQKLPNSEILISFVYEHREISTNRGILFKIKELLKMVKFFAKYFSYNS